MDDAIPVYPYKGDWGCMEPVLFPKVVKVCLKIKAT